MKTLRHLFFERILAWIIIAPIALLGLSAAVQPFAPRTVRWVTDGGLPPWGMVLSGLAIGGGAICLFWMLRTWRIEIDDVGIRQTIGWSRREARWADVGRVFADRPRNGLARRQWPVLVDRDGVEIFRPRGYLLDGGGPDPTGDQFFDNVFLRFPVN